jgi:hypothetical protein
MKISSAVLELFHEEQIDGQGCELSWKETVFNFIIIIIIIFIIIILLLLLLLSSS